MMVDHTHGQATSHTVGDISVADMLLLGIIFVSDGAAMPLLAARNKLSANAALVALNDGSASLLAILPL